MEWISITVKVRISTKNESVIIKYDIYGNPVYINKDGAEKVVYLWGYKGQYLLAEIKGQLTKKLKKR